MSMSAIVSPHAEAKRYDYLSDDFQQRLSTWNHQRLDPARPHDAWQAELAEELRMRRLEREHLGGHGPGHVESSQAFIDLRSSGSNQPRRDRSVRASAN